MNFDKNVMTNNRLKRSTRIYFIPTTEDFGILKLHRRKILLFIAGLNGLTLHGWVSQKASVKEKCISSKTIGLFN